MCTIVLTKIMERRVQIRFKGLRKKAKENEVEE